VNFDWDKGILTLFLSQSVNQRWRNALLNMGSHSSVYNKGPESFKFEGDLAIIPAEERQVQDIINYFKSWIPQITAKYKQILEDERHNKEEQERQRKKMEIEEEEAKARLRKNIKL
jgi:hypothetical protein